MDAPSADRYTSPSASISRRRRARTLGVSPGLFRRSSPNRDSRGKARSRSNNSVHFRPSRCKASLSGSVSTFDRGSAEGTDEAARDWSADIPGDTSARITIQCIALTVTESGDRAAGPKLEARAPSPIVAGSMEFVEFSSRQPADTMRFLESVFGWQFQSRTMPQGEYLAFQAPGGGHGGVRPTRASETPGSLSYVRVDDLARAVTRVTQAGGSIVLPPVDLPGMGSFFWFQAPGGPILACWQDLPAQDSQKE